MARREFSLATKAQAYSVNSSEVTRLKAEAGFSLIEVLVATVIVGVGLIATLSVMKIVNQNRGVSAERSAYQSVGDAILQSNKMLVRSYPRSSFPMVATNNFINASSTSCPAGGAGSIQSEVQASVCNLLWPSGSPLNDVRVTYSVLCDPTRPCVADSPRSVRVMVEFRNRALTQQAPYQRVTTISR